MLFVIASSAVAIAKQEEIAYKDKPTDTLKLKQGYYLKVTAIDVTADKAWMQLSRANGDVVDNCVVTGGECFDMCDDGTLILEIGELTTFQGMYDCIVVIDNLIQYNKNTGNPILSIDRFVLVCPDCA
ncbi:MAG: S-layer protein domain-containing protein [Methanosarcinaceae archaeon]